MPHAAHKSCRRAAVLAGTRILCRSDPAPGIPFVTRVDRGEEFANRLQAARLDVLADPALDEVLRTLLIEGGEILPSGAAFARYQPGDNVNGRNENSLAPRIKIGDSRALTV